MSIVRGVLGSSLSFCEKDSFFDRMKCQGCYPLPDVTDVTVDELSSVFVVWSVVICRCLR